MFEFNKDSKERDSIIFGEPQDWGRKNGGILSFDAMLSEQLDELVRLKHADPETCQNCSPSIAEFLEFLKENQGFLAHGYVVSPNRDDYRVSVEGITYSGDASKEEIITFVNFCHHADELELENNFLRAWWD